MKSLFLTVAVLFSTQAFAAKQLQAVIELSAEDKVTVKVTVAGISTGKVLREYSERVHQLDVGHHNYFECQAGAEINAAVIQYVVMDSAGNLVANSGLQTLNSVLTKTTKDDGSCSSTLPRGEKLGFLTGNQFINLSFPYKGQLVELSLATMIGGSAVIDTNGQYSASLNLDKVESVSFFINNGQGVDGSGRSYYGSGRRPLIDPAKAVDNKPYRYCDHGDEICPEDK